MAKPAHNDKIDLVEIARKLWAHRKRFYIACGIGFAVGVVVSFSLPKTYESDVTLAPEINSGSGLSENLSDIASMVGVDIGRDGSSSVDAIYPELYPEVIGSTPFLVGLFDVRVSTLDGRLKDIRLYDYIMSHQKAAWWAVAQGKFIRWLKKTLSGKDAGAGGKGKINPRQLTEMQNDVMLGIKSSMGCSVDKKTSIISITVTAQDPLVCATLADTIQRRLQEYITAYRTKKARADLEYAEAVCAGARENYEKARRVYGAFGDSNQELVLESVITKRDELENDMQLKYNMYNQTVQQVQIARDRLRAQTPVFTQIQPSTVPVKKSGPKRMTITFVYMLLACMITCAVELYKDARGRGTASGKANAENAGTNTGQGAGKEDEAGE